MDITGVVAGLLIGADVAAHVGYWLGERRSAVERAVVDVAVDLRDVSQDFELTLDDDGDTGLFEDVAAHWDALERALDRLEPTSLPTTSDFT
jgi:hypothetical protein